MKQLKLLLCAILLVAFCGCDIFGNDDDDDNSTPLEGSWRDYEVEMEFLGNQYTLTNFSEKKSITTLFTYNQNNLEMEAVYNNDTSKITMGVFGDYLNFLVSNSQTGDEMPYRYGIYQLVNDSKTINQISLIGIDTSEYLPNAQNISGNLLSKFAGEEMSLDSFFGVSFYSLNLLECKEEKGRIELSLNLKDLEKVKNSKEVKVESFLSFEFERPTSDSTFSNSYYRIDSLKIKCCEYDVNSGIKAVFYDLEFDNKVIVDTLKVDLDFKGSREFAKRYISLK